MADPTRVRRNTERSRYELVVDGQVAGVADFHTGDEGIVVLPHTEVDRSRRGQGLGAELVRGALDDIRTRGGTVDPRCWYVARFIDEHPDYRDLLAQ